MGKGIIAALTSLLVLVGISASALTDSNGLLGSAQTAVIATTMSTAQEEIEFEITNSITDYYKGAYLSNEITSLSEEIDKKLNNSVIDENHFDNLTYSYSSTDNESTITLTYKEGDSETNYIYTGKINKSTGEITWTASDDLINLANTELSEG